MEHVSEGPEEGSGYVCGAAGPQTGRRISRGATPAVRMPRSATVVVAAADHQRGRCRQQDRHRRYAGKRGRLAGDLQSRPDDGRQPLRLVALRTHKTSSTTTHDVDIPQQRGPWSRRVPRGLLRFDETTTSPAENAVGELDTGFNLSKAGATVELINASAAVVSSLTYPALSSDTSYGPAETVTETDLVAAGATATYYAPTSSALGTNWTQPGFNASAWASGPTGLGFANSVPGFATHRSTGRTSGSAAWHGGNGHQHARRTDFGSQPDRERLELHGHRRGRPLQHHNPALGIATPFPE